MARDASWTESLAVGSEEFVERAAADYKPALLPDSNHSCVLLVTGSKILVRSLAWPARICILLPEMEAMASRIR